MMDQETAKKYYDIILACWKAFHEHLSEIEQVIDYDSPTWKTICDDFERIPDAAPPGLKDYADSMARVHVFELEKIWRERKNDR